jgi:hypothetical protein
MKSDQAFRELVSAREARGAFTDAQRGGINAGINGSYFFYRRWLAIIALAMPLLVWIGAAISGQPAGCLQVAPQPALSNYYHCPGGWPGDLFVGSLCAMGFALFCYKGYTRTEDIVLDIAGVCALLVALVPMAAHAGWPDHALPRFLPEPLFSLGSFTVGTHFLAAAVMFLLTAYVAMIQSRKTLELIDDLASRKRYGLIYLVLAILMGGLPLLIVVIHLIGSWTNSRFLFFIEYSGMAVFASYWLVKSREIALILKQ